MKTLSLLVTGLTALGMSSAAFAAPPSEPVEAIVCRGLSAVGFSYEWGGECWCGESCTPNLTSCSPGVCTPNPGSSGCPDCTHTGTYGADCSGFVSKAWQVPEPFAVDSCDVERYVASSFTNDHTYWNVVSMDSLQPADAVASDTHVILVIGYEDAYGDHDVVEAKGCNPGIVRNSRTFASSYSGARRIDLAECVCSDGEEETESCGDCGTQRRQCELGCVWSDWSACEGPDPTDAEGSCAIEGETGACAVGRQLCVAGWLSCLPESATTEICDGLDNDCDGVVDNGTSETLGEGYACTNACGAAESECIDGALRCVTAGTTWPDATCNGSEGVGPEGVNGITGSTGGGCSCRTAGHGTTLPMAPGLALLGLLLWRRRREESDGVER